eukprot:12406739-Karenia_brevis.AAC.1
MFMFFFTEGKVYGRVAQARMSYLQSSSASTGIAIMYRQSSMHVEHNLCMKQKVYACVAQARFSFPFYTPVMESSSASTGIAVMYRRWRPCV